MKMVLLGANSQLGSDIIRFSKLEKINIELIPITRQDCDANNQLSFIKFLQDLSFDILINCISYNRVDDSESHLSEAFYLNAEITKQLAKLCANKKARFIHISTDYVFNGKKSTPYLENDTPGPINVYGESKFMGETFANFFCEETIILRVASLFGLAGSSGKGGNFVETMIKVGKEKGVLKVVNDITMSPTSTLTIAQTIFKLLQNNISSGIYHVVNSGQATWYDFAKSIIEKTKIPADVLPVTSQEFPTAALRPRHSVLNNTKAQSEIGPIPHWMEALDLYLKEKGHIS